MSMVLGAVGQIHISVTDVERSLAFCRDVLGLEHLFTVSGQPMAFFQAGDVRLYLGVPANERFDQGPSSTTGWRTSTRPTPPFSNAVLRPWRSPRRSITTEPHRLTWHSSRTLTATPSVSWRSARYDVAFPIGSADPIQHVTA